MRDQDVRLAVRAHLRSLHDRDSSTRIVEEMGIWSGTVRIDVAVINGELSGFELKSDSDTLERLPTQIEYYGRVFDRLTLVVGQKHAEKARALVPGWWGVMVARDVGSGVELATCRDGGCNPAPDPFLVAQLLWKDEALAVLEEYGLAKGWKSKPARAIHKRLSRELPFDLLSGEVRSRLKFRAGWLGQSVSH